MASFVSHTTTSTATTSTACTSTTAVNSPALVRFVTAGLVATIDSYRSGGLPLHRFAWELVSRVDTLAALDAPARVVTRLRWLQRTVELLNTELAAGGRRELSGDEENSLTVTLGSLRTVLATLSPHSPLSTRPAPPPHLSGHPAAGAAVGRLSGPPL